MPLIFDRPNMVAGKCKVEEKIPVIDKRGKPKIDKEGNEIVKIKTYLFTAADRGKSFNFHDEDKILEKYPLLFRESELNKKVRDMQAKFKKDSMASREES